MAMDSVFVDSVFYDYNNRQQHGGVKTEQGEDSYRKRSSGGANGGLEVFVEEEQEEGEDESRCSVSTSQASLKVNGYKARGNSLSPMKRNPGGSGGDQESSSYIRQNGDISKCHDNVVTFFSTWKSL